MATSFASYRTQRGTSTVAWRRKRFPCNVGAFAVITRKAPHLQVVYFAMCDIKAGDELTIGWGDAPWDELLNLRLVEYAQIAHSHHVHLKFLEALLLKHSLTAPPVPPLPCNKGGVYLSTLDPA